MTRLLLVVMGLVFPLVASAITQIQYSDSEFEHYPVLVQEALKQGLTFYNQKEFLKSFQQLESLAEQGILEAQLTIGAIYIYGEGVPRNFRRAYEWLYRAARQGHVQAQYLVGLFLFNGVMEKEQVKCTMLAHLFHFQFKGADNCIESYAWFNLAASQGDKESKKMLKKISWVLSSLQLIRAQELSSQYFSYSQQVEKQ